MAKPDGCGWILCYACHWGDLVSRLSGSGNGMMGSSEEWDKKKAATNKL
ncbi:MAG: hypothetical protein AB7E31_05540 [Desulfitobacterium sp.]